MYKNKLSNYYYACDYVNKYNLNKLQKINKILKIELVFNVKDFLSVLKETNTEDTLHHKSIFLMYLLIKKIPKITYINKIDGNLSLQQNFLLSGILLNKDEIESFCESFFLINDNILYKNVNIDTNKLSIQFILTNLGFIENLILIDQFKLKNFTLTVNFLLSVTQKNAEYKNVPYFWSFT